MKIKIINAYQWDSNETFHKITGPIAVEAAHVAKTNMVTLNNDGTRITYVVLDILDENNKPIVHNIVLMGNYYDTLYNIVEYYNDAKMMLYISGVCLHVGSYSLQEELDYMETYIRNKLSNYNR